MDKSIKNVLRQLDAKMIGLDEQKRQLKEVLKRWRDSGKGDSCLVTGQRGSGRSSIVNELLEEERKKWAKKDRGDFFINPIHVAQLGSDATAQDAVRGDENLPRIVVIEDADELTSRQRQTLLYSFLDATRRVPWLVILMVNRHDFVSSLEKRVRSRLSTARIIFTGPKVYADFKAALEQFLRTEKDKKWNEFVDQFIGRREVDTELKFMFMVSNSYGVLKTAVAVFLGWIHDPTATMEEVLFIWSRAVATLTPSGSPVINLLNGISLRTFCVFLCVLRRLEKAAPCSTIAYGKVLVDYKHLTNVADSRMRVEDDSVIFKELDQLVKLRILSADTKNNNMSFRRVSLHADSFVLADAVKQRTIPSIISEWYKTIPVN